MHAAYGGVVPELASRDHIRRLLPLTEPVLREAGRALADLDGIAYTQGPGLAGALLVGASVANALGLRAGHSRSLGIHHLEGHLLSPLLADAAARVSVRRAARLRRPQPALCASAASATTRCSATRRTTRPARPSTRPRSCSACRIPGGPALVASSPSAAARGVFALPRPMLDSGDLDLSFSGLKTAVLTLVRERDAAGATQRDGRHRARVRGRDRRRAGREVAGGARRRPACRGWSSPAASAPTASLRERLTRRRRAPRRRSLLSRICSSAPTTAR